jgi:hypothetical protein
VVQIAKFARSELQVDANFAITTLASKHNKHFGMDAQVSCKPPRYGGQAQLGELSDDRNRHVRLHHQ